MPRLRGVDLLRGRGLSAVRPTPAGGNGFRYRRGHPVPERPGAPAYYFAIFGLIPCLGLPLAVAALICGIIGLRHARRNPEARGRVHAWIGIVLGGIETLAWGAVVVLLFLAPFLASR